MFPRISGRPLVSPCLLLLSLAAGGCDTGNAHLGLLGKPAPTISVPGQDLSSLRGHVVVLNFWASWCAPCLLEFPSLAALQQTMPQVRVLAISFDRDPAAYAAFLRRHPFAFQTALDATGHANEAFGTTRPPETYILDKEGVVRRKFIGAQDWTDPEIEGYLRALQ